MYCTPWSDRVWIPIALFGHVWEPKLARAGPGWLGCSTLSDHRLTVLKLRHPTDAATLFLGCFDSFDLALALTLDRDLAHDADDEPLDLDEE